MFSADFIQQVTIFAAFVISGVEGVKRLLKAKSWVAVLLSVLLSLVICLSVLNQGWIIYLIYSAATCLTANGLFKAVHNKSI